MEEQLKLDVYTTREKVEFEWIELSTDFHVLRYKDVAKENFLEKLGKADRHGVPKFTDEVVLLKLKEWVQNKSRAVIPDMSPEDWHASMKALLWECFERHWDPDDKHGAPQGINDGPLNEAVAE